MPSLRRSASSPSVRSSPYPLSLSSAASSRARTAGQQPRRSSGSDVSERRVLADIEWWKVADGQCPPTPDGDQGEAQPTTRVSTGEVATLSAGGSPESLHIILPLYSSELSQPAALDEYIPLVESPTGHGHGRDSSLSSVVSSPEIATPPLQAVDLDVVSPVSDLDSPASELPWMGIGIRPLSLPLPFRSFSFGGISDHKSCHTHFADMGGDSFSLDQNLFS
ncbi:hypothetical protein EDD16DRAFT_497171 [Pisolithus croceorrhizus]|nr:hypothetical protein EDD16DRAFT_497171 [Pisolithus croceorrhizus]KAI6127807.1 hypothetical protein EV401DRAFT_968061 [Pisolithus croceorrhizus]